MTAKKNVFVIIGSASSNSANQKIVDHIINLTSDKLIFTVFDDLKKLPHFDPELSLENAPVQVVQFRDAIDKAEGVLICTPEYVFSIPSGLKNAIEWCVSTTVFSDKPLGIITASASGEKGHEELQLIMKTIMTVFNEGTTLLIRGVKGKVDDRGNIIDVQTLSELERFATAYEALLFA